MLIGKLVRSLSLGHQLAGVYTSRSRAAHWDSKNEYGESVASGIYFYILTAGDFRTTRKMLIQTISKVVWYGRIIISALYTVSVTRMVSMKKMNDFYLSTLVQFCVSYVYLSG